VAQKTAGLYTGGLQPALEQIPGRIVPNRAADGDGRAQAGQGIGGNASIPAQQQLERFLAKDQAVGGKFVAAHGGHLGNAAIEKI
jgi:hypothetical protein